MFYLYCTYQTCGSQLWWNIKNTFLCWKRKLFSVGSSTQVINDNKWVTIMFFLCSAATNRLATQFKVSILYFICSQCSAEHMLCNRGPVSTASISSHKQKDTALYWTWSRKQGWAECVFSEYLICIYVFNYNTTCIEHTYLQYVFVGKLLSWVWVIF